MIYFYFRAEFSQIFCQFIMKVAYNCDQKMQKNILLTFLPLINQNVFCLKNYFIFLQFILRISWHPVASYQYYLKIKMPFKHKLIKELQKNIRSVTDCEEVALKLEVINDKKDQQKHKSKLKKKLVFKNYSMFQLILNREPIADQHVVNFYNIIGINQKAIRVPDFEQSFISTVFYLKNVKKVEVRPNTVILHMVNAPLKSAPLQYIIERFKSFGDLRFYNLANLVSEASKRLKVLNQIEVNQNTEESNDFLEKYIQQMGNKMYCFRGSVNKLVLSRSFLQALQYNVEDFALDCIRYKACLTQFMSAQPYFDIIYKMIENVRNLFDLLADKISLQTFLESSVMRFKDFMITKNYVLLTLQKKKLFCKIKVGMPNPMINLLQIEEIINRSENTYDQNGVYKKRKIDIVKQERQSAQINHVRNIIKLPRNILPENKDIVTNYLNDDKIQKPDIWAGQTQ